MIINIWEVIMMFRDMVKSVCCAMVLMCGIVEVSGMMDSASKEDKSDVFAVTVYTVSPDGVIPEMHFGKLTLKELNMPSICSFGNLVNRLQCELLFIQKSFQERGSFVTEKFDVGGFMYDNAYWICNKIQNSGGTDLGAYCRVFMAYCDFLREIANGDFDYEESFHMAAYGVAGGCFLSVQESPIMHLLSYNGESLISNQALVNTIGEYLLAYYYEYYRNSEEEFDREYLFGEVNKLLSTQGPTDSLEKINSIITQISMLDTDWYKKVTNPFLWAFNQSIK
jgi:hypothetical protein